MARILILIAGPLWTNPRSRKEAQALADAGHDVRIGGVWFDGLAAARDRELGSGQRWKFEPFLDLRPGGALRRLRRARAQVERRAALASFAAFGLQSAGALGYAPRSLLARASASSADLILLRSEVGLWIGDSLLRRGRRVGLDFEDWYSEDYPAEARDPRRISWLKAMELRLASACSYRVASSHAMADAIATEYAVKPPAVVYNVFPPPGPVDDAQGSDRLDPAVPSIHWFSQTIGPGRGLETFFLAAEKVALPFEVHLRGNLGNHAAWLERCISPRLRPRVHVHPSVPGDRLHSRIGQHDIGLALESTQVRSRDLTITNKLFQYLQAGLAVIATDTAGQREVFSKCPGIGAMVKDGDPAALQGALEHLLSDRQALAAAKKSACAAIDGAFGWEHQRRTIVGLAEEALRR